jgi:hypothetical protein
MKPAQLNRKAFVRPKSRHPRNGLGYLQYDALWRYSEEPQYKRLANRATHVLVRLRLLRETNPQVFYQSPFLPRSFEDTPEAR